MLRSSSVRLYVIGDRSAAHMQRLAGLDITEDPGEADALLNTEGDGARLRAVWRSAQRVRWVHSTAAGVEGQLFDELVRSDVVLTNSRGVFARSLAEWVMSAMLWFAKDLDRMRRQQQAREWRQFEVQMLHGRTLGVVGFGEIGRATAGLAEAFGMRVLAMRRRPGAGEYGRERLPEMLRECDYVLVAAALTPETRELVGAEAIAAMQPDAVLINVGRGPVVDEAALVDALANRRVRGAALDVFDTEPLPSDHPFWAMDNVLLSPHTADRTATWLDEAIDLFLENVERYRRGEPLRNVVDMEAGY